MRTKTPWPWIALILSFLVLAGAAVYAHGKSRIKVHFSVQTSQPGRLQVFHDAGGRFSEAKSTWLRTADDSPLDATLKIRGRGATQLRLDPPTTTVTTVCGLRLGGDDMPAQFEVLHTSEVSVTGTTGCLQLQSGRGARDPQVSLRFVDGSAARIDSAGWWHWIKIAALVGLALIGARLGYLLLHQVQALARLIPVVPGFGRFQERAHWVCAAIMLVFGMAYIVVTPPGAVADEEAHFAKIIRISQGAPFGDSGSRMLPNPRAMYGSFVDYLRNKRPFTREQLEKTLEKPLLCEATSSNVATNANGYFPHQYVLPTLVYMAGCASGASFGQFLHVARALNLLLATALVAWGVALAARGKLGLFFIALLPMSLFQMSSLSADAMVLSLSIAWLGLVSGIAGGKLEPRRAALALWILSLAIAFLKPGSAWILACLLLCKPAYDAAGESFGAAIVKHLGIPWVVHAAVVMHASGSAEAAAWGDSTANIHFLTSDPVGFLRMLVATFYYNGVWLVRTMIGVLGWLDVPLSWWVYWAASLLGLAAFLANDESIPDLPRYVTPLACLAILGSLVIIALPLFIYWTSPGATTISGLQGRYFTVTAAFALVWCSFRSPRQIQAVLSLLIVVGVSAFNLDAVHRLYEAYFVVGRG